MMSHYVRGVSRDTDVCHIVSTVRHMTLDDVILYFFLLFTLFLAAESVIAANEANHI